MNIELTDIITIVGTMGGIEGVKWAVRAWLNRKTDARKEDAAADGMEIQNLLSVITNLSGQLDKSDIRMVARDGKVDFLYSENNKLREDNLELIKKIHELELRLQETEVKRCDIRGCTNRIPPSDY